jgi:hypothetical protein
MTTMVPIYNNDEQQRTPYNYPYPPHYASVSHGIFDKPPSYEQTIQTVSETNNHRVEDAPALLPAPTSLPATTEPIESTRNQN